MRTQSDYLTTGEVAREVRVHVATVGRWINEGKLRAVRLGEGGTYRIRRIDFDDFIREQKPQPEEVA